MTKQADTAHCMILDGPPFVCVRCGREFEAENKTGRCKKGTKPTSAKLTRKRRRPRTESELAAVDAACAACKLFVAGMCLEIARRGCQSCKNADDFAQKIARGIKCPKGLFEATPLMESTP